MVSVVVVVPVADEFRPLESLGRTIAATLSPLNVTYAWVSENAIQLGLSATLTVAASVSLTQSTTLTDLLMKFRK